MSILKLKDSQGNWIGVPTIKGDKGNGISSAVLNNDYTLTLTFTDGTTYTTPSIRGEKGEQGEPATDMDIHICSLNEYDSETRIPTITSPDDKTFYLVPTVDGTSPDLFTEWVYVNNAWEMFGSAKIDLSGYLTDVQINGSSIVNDGVANVPIATQNVRGVVKGHSAYGVGIFSDGSLYLKSPSDSMIKQGMNNSHAIKACNQDSMTFYGLAKAASDTTQSQSSNAVGQYTDSAKDKIQTMLGVSPLIAPHESDPFESAHVIGELFIVNGKLYRAKTTLTAGEYINEGTNVEVVDVAEVLDGKVDDVQVNGTSVVTDGVANVPVASANDLGAVKINSAFGISVNGSGALFVSGSSQALTKEGRNGYKPITPDVQHSATFYGLAKSAGDTTQSASSNAVGNYTDNAKDKIQAMLGVSPLIAPHESDPFESAHTIGELFIINGKLYRAKTALTAGEYINEGTNVEVVNVAGVLDEKVGDVQINGTSIVADGVANIPLAKAGGASGAVKLNSSLGITESLGTLTLAEPNLSLIKSGGSKYYAISPKYQHESTFYGLAKSAGDTTQSASSNAVGNYTDTAKGKIHDMLGIGIAKEILAYSELGEDMDLIEIPLPDRYEKVWFRFLCRINNAENNLANAVTPMAAWLGDSANVSFTQTFTVYENAYIRQSDTFMIKGWFIVDFPFVDTFSAGPYGATNWSAKSGVNSVDGSYKFYNVPYEKLTSYPRSLFIRPYETSKGYLFKANSWLGVYAK